MQKIIDGQWAIRTGKTDRDESRDDLITVRDKRPYYTPGLHEFKVLVKCEVCGSPVITFNWKTSPVICGRRCRTGEQYGVYTALEDMREAAESLRGLKDFLPPPTETVSIDINYSTCKPGKVSRFVSEPHRARLWLRKDSVSYSAVNSLQEAITELYIREGQGRMVTRLRQIEAANALYLLAIAGWSIDGKPYTVCASETRDALDDDTFYSLFEAAVMHLITPPAGEAAYSG
jgi:hypothetical protein